MTKVLLVFEHGVWMNPSVFATILRNLGIDFQLAYVGSVTDAVRTDRGRYGAASAAIRNYFRNFNAVFVMERAPITTAYGVRAAVHWLRWNEPDDPPIVYFGWNFSTVNRELDTLLPADFPFIRPDPNNLADTVAIADNGVPFASEFTQRFGTSVYLLREGKRLYVPTYNIYTGDNRLGYWRLDMNKHASLGTHGEILAIPDHPDESYPHNAIAAYRYRNRYLLPATAQSFGYIITTRDAIPNATYLFWFLYGLKLAGVAPRWALPIHLETDHPLEVLSNSVLSYRQQIEIERDVFAWLNDFCRATGLVVCNGVRVGGRDRAIHSLFHWNLIHHSNPEIRTVAQQLHQILIQGHIRGTLPCGVHDHSITNNNTRGYWGDHVHYNFRRHINPHSLYGAPHDVPRMHGRYQCARHVLPPDAAGSDARRTIMGDADILEWGFEGRMTGSAVQFDLPMGSVHAARIIIESEIDEMRAMGFPDGHCGEHRYTNTAANNAGGECYWQAAKEMGFKGMRSAYHCNANGGAAVNKTVPYNRIWNGFHLLMDCSLDSAQVSPLGCWGLYDPRCPTSGHAVAVLNLDYNGDIINEYPNSVWRAYRRAMCRLLSDWLMVCVVFLGAPYIHPVPTWMGVSLSQPVARFSGLNILNAAGTPHFNPTVEMLECMRDIISVLSNYLFFGSVSDVIKARERVIG
ncbi:MAG: hypothetical protein ABDI19_06000 [Armatimonadota bacterium]